MKYLWFGNLQEVVGKLVFEIWNIKEAAVNQFAHFSYEILIVLESPGNCCEAFMGGLESQGSCCEAICTFQMKY